MPSPTSALLPAHLHSPLPPSPSPPPPSPSTPPHSPLPPISPPPMPYVPLYAPERPPSPSPPPHLPPSPPKPKPLPPPKLPSPPPPVPSPPPRSPPPRCVCSNAAGRGHTLHAPPQVAVSAPRPCFEYHTFYPSTNAVLYGYPCFFEPEANGGWAEMGRWIHCLTPGFQFKPGRTSAMPNAIFLVGNSHAGALIPGVQAVAAAANMAFAASTGAGLNFEGQDEDPRLAQLQDNMRAGDILVIAGRVDRIARPEFLQWYSEVVIPWITRIGAKIVLIGDNYELKRSGSMCRPPNAVHLCSYTMADMRAGGGCSPHCELCAGDGRCPRPDTILSFNSTLQHFADQHSEVVHFFSQLDLWLDHSGRGSNIIPGTNVNGYIDEHHLNPQGAKYLWPYMCAAFQEWGLFT